VRLVRSGATALLCGALVANLGGARAAAPAVSGDASDVNVARVVANVRKAIGYDAVARLTRGLVLQEDAGARASDVEVLWLGTHGEYRQAKSESDPRALGFDGRFAWQLDRTGYPAPMPQRLREKVLIPAWVRGDWWLSGDPRLVLTVLPAETNEKRVALAMRLEHGLVGAKIYVNRATWLPSALVVDYERGPYTLRFEDYRQTPIGVRFPTRTSADYRGETTEHRLRSVAAIASAARDPFAVPPLPRDTAFDDGRPAELDVAQGVPFSASAPGHFYARASVDGADAGWFHLDTGSDTLQIDAKVADDLGMPVLGTSETFGADGRPQKVTIRRGKSFQLGRVTIKNPIFLASDMTGKNAPPGQKRAGIVGFPVFARVVAEVTGGGKRVALYDPTTYRLAKGRWQDLSYVDLTPAVTCRFEGERTGLFQLDTGAAGTVTFYKQYIEEQRLLEARNVREESAVGAGGAYRELSGKVAWFELAGHRFANPDAGFRIAGLSREGAAGVVGRAFLSAFEIVFDYPNRRVAFVE
jgi:Aspartyl protease